VTALAPPSETSAAKVQAIAAHTRRTCSKEDVGEADSIPFFDEARVPVETIPVPNTEIEGLSADQFEVVGEKISYRLAQRPGSYVVLKYVRTLIKRKDTQTMHCPPAPQGVIDGSRADVSFVAGLIVDKNDLCRYRHEENHAASRTMPTVFHRALNHMGSQMLYAA
jgi:transposase